MKLYNWKDLHNFIMDILIKLKVPNEEAEIVAESLVRADLEGLSSHGISRLCVYSKRLLDKRINNKPNIKYRMLSPAISIIDGDNGLGMVVTHKALKEGFEMAANYGMAILGIHSSNHFGTASYFCQLANEEDMILMACTNSPSAMAPWGGDSAFFGTNPIAFSFPLKNQTPVIIDLSTTTVARGKIILAKKEGKAIPDNWAIDNLGNNTENPNDALKGSLLPMGGAKGAALALAVEILTTTLTGASISKEVKNIYNNNISERANVGHFFILINTKLFKNILNYEEQLTYLLKTMKDTQGNDIRYPGERKESERLIREKEGIRLSKDVLIELKNLARKLNISFPKEINS